MRMFPGVTALAAGTLLLASEAPPASSQEAQQQTAIAAKVAKIRTEAADKITLFGVAHGKVVNGWRETNSHNFRIIHDLQDTDAEAVAVRLEEIRKGVQEQWLCLSDEGKKEHWSPRCSVYLYPEAKQYVKETGVPENILGYSRSDSPTNGRVPFREICTQGNPLRLLDTILAHEVTHVTIAEAGINASLPRWVDEGVATNVQQWDMQAFKDIFLKLQADNELLSLKEVLELEKYPPTFRRLNAFYTQSTLLVHMLSREKKGHVLFDVVRDARGKDGSYENAFQKHFRCSQEELWEKLLKHAGSRESAPAK